MTRSPRPDTPGWTVLGGRAEGDAVPDLPPDLWDVAWRSTDRSILVSDPIYGRRLTLSVCEHESDGRVTRFAVREVSNGMYLFAIPPAG
jgi:hypothetical protein